MLATISFPRQSVIATCRLTRNLNELKLKITYVEMTRYGHFKSMNITIARLTGTSDLCHLRCFRKLQKHLNYMPAVPASLLKLNTEDYSKFAILFFHKLLD